MDQPANTTSPPITAENHLSPPVLPPSESNLIKPEPQERIAITQVDQRNPQSKQQAPMSTSTAAPPSISVTELCNLSSEISSFQNYFNTLKEHLNTLKTKVDSLINTISPQENASIALIPTENSLQESSPQIVTTSIPIEKKSGEETTQPDRKTTLDSNSELESLCITMNGKGLKRYLVSNLNEMNKLREEVPKALKLASSPAKIVIECAGKFFLQGSKAYIHKDSPMVAGREASVLVLECFLLMGAEENKVEIEKEAKDEAEQNAISWRKRIFTEGGISKANETDARGLLLLIGCFGVPKVFKIEDLRDLLNRSRIREISRALKKSTVLTEKVPEIIEGMIKIKMEIEAVDLSYTFGLEERFSPQMLLNSYLQNSLESPKNTKEAQTSLIAQNEANKRKLSALKSVLRCLEAHAIDPSKLLPKWQIKEKITTLKNELNEFDKKKREEKTQKRKADEQESAKKMKRRVGPGPGVPKKNVGQVSNHRHGQINSYTSASPILYAPGAGQYTSGVYGGRIVDPSSVQVVAAGHNSQYASAYGGIVVEQPGVHETNQYAWRGDPSLNERLVSHSYGGGDERVVSHSHGSYVGPSSTSSINGLYSLEQRYGIAPSGGGGSSVGVTRSRVSDLYQFADAVVSNEYQPAAGPTHHAYM